MEEFYKENNILHPNLHGGRKQHSTKTDITSIYNNALKYMQ